MRLSEIIRIWEKEIENKTDAELRALKIELQEKRENTDFYTKDDIEVLKSKLYRLNRLGV